MYVQPGPEETWRGTDSRVAVRETPVLVASGYPHTCGETAQFTRWPPVPPVGAARGVTDGTDAIAGDNGVPVGASETTYVGRAASRWDADNCRKATPATTRAAAKAAAGHAYLTELPSQLTATTAHRVSRYQLAANLFP